VIHCKGHQKGEDKIAKGNKVADEAAKWANAGIYSWSSSLGGNSPRETLLNSGM
jgi:hypothetical protein